MDKDFLVGCITGIIITLIITLGIAIPCSISEKRNIDKEIMLKRMEIYGEPINQEEKK